MSERFFDAISRLVREITRPMLFLGSYRYRVVSVAGGIADLQRAPIRRRPDGTDPAGLPDLARCALRSGVPGGGGDPMLGSFVLVRFTDGDKNDPYIEAFEGESTPGYLPTRAAVDASSHVDVGASASTVNAGASASTVNIGSSSSAVKLAGAGGRVLRSGEKIIINATGAVVSGSSGSILVNGTITIDPALEPVPGNPGTGYSQVLA